MTRQMREPVAILLAAGSGSRLGADKPFVKVAGKTLLYWAIRPYRKSSRIEDIVVVIPPGPEARERFEPYRTPRIHLVENEDPSGGMISSIRAGLQSTWCAERNFMLSPADLPFVTTEIVERVIQTFLTRGPRIVLPAYKGLGGHPGLFEAGLRDDFYLHGDQHGAREILRRHANDTVRLNLPEPDICFDIDTPEDLAIADDVGARWARVEKEAEARRKLRYQ